MSAPPEGLVVVFEGKRSLVIFRRFFYPVTVRDEDFEVVVYSDTGREREVTYNRADQYGLDDPFKVMSLIRLARATKVLRVEPATDKVQNLSLTICRSTELIGPDAAKDEWIPFDPSRLRPLEERVRDTKKRARWKQRLASG